MSAARPAAKIASRESPKTSAPTGASAQATSALAEEMRVTAKTAIQAATVTSPSQGEAASSTPAPVATPCRP